MKLLMLTAMVSLTVLVVVAPAQAQSQSAAPAQGCETLTRLASVDLMTLPNDGRMLVPVTINGAPEKLLLGTAGGLITLNRAATEALDLRAVQSASRLLDANGYASRRFVRVDDFTVGNMHAAKRTFALTPDPNAGTNPPDDGIFDVGLRYRFDVEMDFASRKLNYFSPDHCEGHVVYWPATVVGVVPLTVRHRTDDNARHGAIAGNAALLASASQENLDYLISLIESAPGIAGSDIRIKVMLDGEAFTANIDTALEYSTLNSQAARSRFDVKADSPGSAPVASLVENDPNRKAGTSGAPESVTVYGSFAFAHTFHTLTFGDVTVINPHFLVRPDQTGKHDPDNRYLAGSHIFQLDDNVEPDISIGMDVLSKLHLYFAFPEGKLYVTPAAPVEAASAAPAPLSAPAQ